VPLENEVYLVRTTSDEFFARPNPLTVFESQPLDLAFIDGMHLGEFVYRDFCNVERHSGPATVVVFDDVLPRTAIEAARHRETEDWTGDVFKAVEVIGELRSDLILIPVDTDPTGVLVALHLDRESTTLPVSYDRVVTRLQAPDPQNVPVHVLQRVDAMDPADFLASPMWTLIRRLRNGTIEPDAAWSQIDTALAMVRRSVHLPE
jgi:hypothetical protein